MYKFQILNPKSPIKNYKIFKFPVLVICSLFIILSSLLSHGNLALYAQDTKEEEAFFVAKKAFEDGFYEVSLGLLERFLKNYPESLKLAEAELLIGQCYFHQNRYLDALTKFEKLLNQPYARNLKDAVIYWIAEVHFKGNSFAKASEYYRRVIEEFPTSSYLPYAYYSLSWCLFQEELYEEALKQFKIVEERFSEESFSQDVSFKIVECLYNLKKYGELKEKAKSYLNLYSKDTSKIPYLYFYIAEANYYLDNFPEAIDWYSKVILNTNDKKTQALSRLGMGWAYLKLKQYKEAEASMLEVNSIDLEKKSLDTLLLGKAILYFETKDFQEAKSAYDELITTAENPIILIQAYLGKSDALYNLNDFKFAIKSYRQALDMVSVSVPQEIIDKIHYGLAWAFLKEGEFKEAISEFQKIVKYTEDKIIKVAALCHIGDAYQDSADYPKSIETYNSILKDYPDSLYSDYVQYQLGIALLKAGNYDGAILSFSALKSNYPNSKLLDDASYALGLSYFQREDYSASKEIFLNFQEEFKESTLRPQVIYLLGTSLYNLAKYAEAIEVFKDLIRMSSQDTELIQKAEYEIADCYYQMGNEKEAVTRFKALRSKYPDSALTAEIMWWLGEYYYRQNNLNLARRYFSSLIQDFPKNNLVPDAYYALGSTYFEESLYSEAIENFKKVIEFGESDLAGQATIAIADIYLKQNKKDLSLEKYNEAIGKYDNLANLIYPKIANLYYQRQDFKEALDYYYKSLDMVPIQEMVNIHFRIAEILQELGKTDAAIEEYLKITYLYSENNALAIKALLRIAKIYEDKENFPEASNIYKKIAVMDIEEAKFAQDRIDWIKANVK